MHYLTHALSPGLALLDTEVATVTARGSGVLTDDRRRGGFDNPFPAEVGLFTLRGSAAIAQVTMAFFQTGRSYYEGFSVYGDRGGVEWPADNDGPLTVYAMTRSGSREQRQPGGEHQRQSSRSDRRSARVAAPVRGGRRARRLASRSWSTASSAPCSVGVRRRSTPAPPPRGPPRASVRTRRHWRTGGRSTCRASGGTRLEREVPSRVFSSEQAESRS